MQNRLGFSFVFMAFAAPAMAQPCHDCGQGEGVVEVGRLIADWGDAGI